MKHKTLTVLGTLRLVVLLLILISFIYSSFFYKTSNESWFAESSPDSQYTITGEEINSSPLSLMGGRNVRISVTGPTGTRSLFETTIANDGNIHSCIYNINWTEDGFSITLDGDEQKPITYIFRWEDIF